MTYLEFLNSETAITVMSHVTGGSKETRQSADPGSSGDKAQLVDK